MINIYYVIKKKTIEIDYILFKILQILKLTETLKLL